MSLSKRGCPSAPLHSGVRHLQQQSRQQSHATMQWAMSAVSSHAGSNYYGGPEVAEGKPFRLSMKDINNTHDSIVLNASNALVKLEGNNKTLARVTMPTTDGFEVIGRTKGRGDTNTSSHFHYRDENTVRKKAKKSKSAAPTSFKDRQIRSQEKLAAINNINTSPNSISIHRQGEDPINTAALKASKNTQGVTFQINHSDEELRKPVRLPVYIAKQMVKSRASSVPHWFYGSKSRGRMANMSAEKYSEGINHDSHSKSKKGSESDRVLDVFVVDGTNKAIHHSNKHNNKTSDNHETNKGNYNNFTEFTNENGRGKKQEEAAEKKATTRASMNDENLNEHDYIGVNTSCERSDGVGPSLPMIMTQQYEEGVGADDAEFEGNSCLSPEFILEAQSIKGSMSLSQSQEVKMWKNIDNLEMMKQSSQPPSTAQSLGGIDNTVTMYREGSSHSPRPNSSNRPLGILRTLPLQTDLDKYVHYLSASKKRSSLFTNSFHRYVQGMEGRPGGPISRPYQSSTGVMDRQKSIYGDDAMNKARSGGNTVNNLVGQQKRINANQEKLKTQLKDNIIRSGSAHTSVHSRKSSAV